MYVIPSQKDKRKTCRCGALWKLHYHPKEQWYDKGVVGSATCKGQYGSSQVMMFLDLASMDAYGREKVRVHHKRGRHAIPRRK